MSFRQGVILPPPLPQNESLKIPPRLGLKHSTCPLPLFLQKILVLQGSAIKLNLTKKGSSLKSWKNLILSCQVVKIILGPSVLSLSISWSLDRFWWLILNIFPIQGSLDNVSSKSPNNIYNACDKLSKRSNKVLPDFEECSWRKYYWPTLHCVFPTQCVMASFPPFSTLQ